MREAKNTSSRVVRTYFAVTGLYTLSASLIWGGVVHRSQGDHKDRGQQRCPADVRPRQPV